MKHFSLACILLFLFVFAPVKAFGCECSPGSQIEEFKRSQSVILVRLIETPGDISKLRVVKSWKGAKVNKIIYLKMVVLCESRIDFVKADKATEFLLYLPFDNGKPLYKSKSPTFIFDCGRSDSAENAKDDIKNMDKIAAESKNR